MSKVIHVTTTVTLHPNGLALVTVIMGDYTRRDLIARGHVTYNLDDAVPSLARLVRDAAEAVQGSLNR
jgi:hypothetical protein